MASFLAEVALLPELGEEAPGGEFGGEACARERERERGDSRSTWKIKEDRQYKQESYQKSTQAGNYQRKRTHTHILAM
jgi:hypothetical protein